MGDFSDTLLSELNERSREIFRHIVDAYVTTGEPIGSRTLARRMAESISPATVRNVMADLEELGLLAAPHVSAGRLPTQAGLRLFVSGLMEVGDLPEDERRGLRETCATAGHSLEEVLGEASARLSVLSHCASLVMAPKSNARLKHLEFVQLSAGRVLVVLVGVDGSVENRLLEVPADLPPAALMEATNYLNAHLIGRTLDEVRETIDQERAAQQQALDALTAKIIDAGVAAWAGGVRGTSLIVRGQSNLLGDDATAERLSEIRRLFDALETKDHVLELLEVAGRAEGVQIFIGSENKLFEGSGLSMIVAPYQDHEGSIVGAIGVVGPTRINYARIIPMVDYTARLIGRLIG